MSAFFMSQMDYVFFIYGLSFFFLALVVYFLSRIKPAYPFWKWIFLFALLHGVVEWLDMVSISFWTAPFFRIVKLIFLVFSFLCFVELMREQIRRDCGKACGPVLYIFLLLAVIVPGWMIDQWAGINVLARYILGVIGGSGAAYIIFHCGRKEDEKRGLLSVFAGLLGCYALTQIFVPASKVFPSSVINQGMFLGFAGIPIQVFRMILACSMAFVVWKYYLSMRREQSALTKEAHFLQAGILFPLALVVFVLIGWGATCLLSEKRMDEKKKVLFALAQYSAHAQDPAVVASFTGTPADLESANYKAFFKEAMGTYLRYPDAVSIYLFGRKDGHTIFLFDSMNPLIKDDSVPSAQPGEVYPEDAQLLADMFRQGGTVVIGPEEDKWGNFMSGLSAIRSPDTGKVIAVLGVDYVVEEWMKDVAGYRMMAIAIAGLFVVLFIVFFFIYMREKEVQQHLKDREHRLLELSALLEEERVGLETIFNSTQVGLMLVDPQLQIKRVNAVLSRLVGREAQAILGNRPGQGLSCIYLDAKSMTCGHSEACAVCPLSRMVKNAMATGDQVRDFEYRHQHNTVSGDPKTLWLQINASPLLIGGQRHILLSLADITARKIAQQELDEYHSRLEDLVKSRTEALNRTNQQLTREIMERQEANRELQEAKNKAEEASRLKSQFLFNVSHEIRTPLNGIMGFAELIARCEDLDRARMMSRTILHESDILLTLVNDVLDQAKIEAGKMTFESKPVDLKDVLSGMMKTLTMAANKKGLIVSLESSGDVPQFVLTDRLRLCQVLWNLSGNAIKFTQEGSVILRTELFDRRLDQAWIKFSVKDTGTGIPDEKKHLVFERFSQVDGASTRKFGGAGLGMSIAKGLVELMGGNIGFESNPGQGSTFWFVLPLKVCAESQLPQERPRVALALEAAVGLRGPILVVEDYPVNQDVVRMHMEAGGYEGDFASDGFAAVKACASKEYKLILMDIQMPGMDGYETTRQIRALGGWAASVPVLGVTANADENTRKKCLDIGMIDVMTKPIRGQIFLTLLGHILAGKGAGLSVAKPGEVVMAEDQSAKVMDYEEAVKEFAGNKVLLDTVVGRFLAQVKKQFDVIAQAIAAKDSDMIGREAHKIKGAAANLTAMRVSLYAKAMEQKGKNADLDGIDVLFVELKNEVALLEDFVKKGHKYSA